MAARSLSVTWDQRWGRPWWYTTLKSSGSFYYESNVECIEQCTHLTPYMGICLFTDCELVIWLNALLQLHAFSFSGSTNGCYMIATAFNPIKTLDVMWPNFASKLSLNLGECHWHLTRFPTHYNRSCAAGEVGAEGRPLCKQRTTTDWYRSSLLTTVS